MCRSWKIGHHQTYFWNQWDSIFQNGLVFMHPPKYVKNFLFNSLFNCITSIIFVHVIWVLLWHETQVKWCMMLLNSMCHRFFLVWFSLVTMLMLIPPGFSFFCVFFYTWTSGIWSCFLRFPFAFSNTHLFSSFSAPGLTLITNHHLYLVSNHLILLCPGSKKNSSN